MKIESFRKLLLTSTVSILALIFSSTFLSAQKQVPEKEKYGGTLTVAVPADAKSLDARYLPGSATTCYGEEKIYDRLVDYSGKGAKEINPILAESWKQVDDLTWLVNIRKGVKFHNGKELTAEDIWKNIDWKLNPEKYTKEKGWRPPRVRTYATPFIKNVEVIDKHTLKFNLKAPFAAFVNACLNWVCQGIIDPDVVEKYGKEATLHPVGTGAFKYVEWVSGDHITLEAFDGYWGGRPYLNRVIFRPIPDSQTRLIALQKGEVDVAEGLPLNSLPLIKKDPNLAYYVVEDVTRRKGVIQFNLRRWPMNQLKFRQAVVMGVDWVKITKTAFPEGTAVFCRSFLKGSWAENPEAEKLIPSYNPKKAMELMKEVEREAGKPLPKEIDALVDREEIQSAILMMAADQLKKIGVNLRTRSLEYNIIGDILRRQPKPDWDIALYDVKGPGMDPFAAAKEFHSKTPNAADGKNIAAYDNPEVDKLVEKGNSISNREERKKLYQQVEKIALRDLPILPIFNLPRLTGYNKKVHDLRGHDSLFLFLKSPWNNIWIEKGKK